MTVASLLAARRRRSRCPGTKASGGRCQNAVPCPLHPSVVRDVRCPATNRDGSPCRSLATGSGFCPAHRQTPEETP